MKKDIFLILMLFTAFGSQAQLTPLKSQYFINQYLINPAMAGKEDKTSIFINYSSQWSKIEGAPVQMSLSASTSLSEKAGVGVNIISDKAGLLQKTQAMGSFAYMVPFDDEHNLRFGLSLAWTSERMAIGDATENLVPDPALTNFNDKRKNVIDGNFGVAYINSGLEAQFSYLSLNQKRSRELSTVDYSIFYSSASYEFNRERTVTIKPLVAFRGIKGYKNQWDIASEFSFDNMFNLYTMYHSNRSISAGAGYDYYEKFNISATYNSEPRNIRGFSGGVIDLIVGVMF